MTGSVDPPPAASGPAAQETSDRLWAAFAHAPSGLCLLDLDGRIEAANPVLCRFLGRSAADLVSRRLASLAHSCDGPLLEARLRADGRAGGDAPVEVRFVREGGDLAWGATRVHLVRSAAGAPASWVVWVEDVTERRRAEDLLQENEEKFRIAFENAPVGMSIVIANGQYLAVNEALCQMFGYTREELMSGTIHRVTHPDDVEHTKQWIRKMIANDFSEPELYKRYIHRDGHVVWGVVRARWVRDASGAPRFSVVHIQDVTEQKRAEEERARLEAQLYRAQKLEAIGQLAGGVAHDFNNLLTAIGSNASVALTEPDVPAEVRTMLVEISQAVTSGAHLVRQLLAFSRREVVTPRVLNLNDVVLSLRRLLQRLLGEEVELRTALHPGVGQVRIDPGHAEQILFNLAVNARDAMEGRGVLTIETANVRLDGAYARTHDAAPGEYVLLAVSDTGCGMTEETRSRIFEPFYTTKERGKGTGLGLAMVYGAVKQSGGHIDVYSEPGRGSTFKLHLPRADAPAEAWSWPGAEEVKGGCETILLVEDDAAVRGPAKRMLQHLGYVVHAYASGVDAVAAAEALSAADLLVTDVAMPKMNGRELAERLCALRPGLRVLFTSGYTQNVIAHHGILDPGLEFLPKPYSLESLARRVREVLDGRPDAPGPPSR